MKLNKHIPIVSLLGLAMISSTAYSDNGSEGTGDSMQHTCQACIQIPFPKLACASVDAVARYCGSEDWWHNGNQDCKRFLKITQFCAMGGIQIFTQESWTGAGSYCNPGESPDCEN